MLLATGIYPHFVTAVAELTTLRFRPRSLAMLGTIGLAASSVILLLAGPTKQLVLERRWIMYSLFIGLTVGGVPIVWRLVRAVTPSFLIGSVVGLLVMVAMALSGPGPSGAGAGSPLGLFVAGMAGATAMVLPGVSGGYLLLVLGQYVPILAGIDALKRGLLVPLATGSSPDAALVAEALAVAIPVGLGVVVGIAAVSNLMRWTLGRFPKATLGVLLGLLLGAVVGLWPFQSSVPPSEPARTEAGLEPAQRVDPEPWAVERFSPSSAQAAACLLLIGLGFSATLAVGRLGEVENP
jgi:putative membrane protein